MVLRSSKRNTDKGFPTGQLVSISLGLSDMEDLKY